MGKIQNARGANGTGPEYNINFNLRDENPKSGFNPFEIKHTHKFRGQPVQN